MNDLLILVSEAVNQNIVWERIEDRMHCFVMDMSRTLQNMDYHAEGDVWTHTKRVCEAMVQLCSFRALTEDRQRAVFLAALLHDVGKIVTTRFEDGKWVSPNHSSVGAKLARQFMWLEMGLCGTPEKQQLRETVCYLIRYHSFPPYAIDDPDGKRKLRAIAANGDLAPLFNLDLLCILCEADALGRECKDGTDRLRMADQVQLCRELALECDCLYKPYPFPSEFTRYSYLSGMEIAPDYELYNDSWGEVIMLSGLPGTGKDTWIQKYYSDYPVISLDDIRRELGISATMDQKIVVETARERAKELLRKHRPFIWNATDLTLAVRQRQIRLFHQYHAFVKIVCLETAWDEQLRRNAARTDTVPAQAIYHMLEGFNLPEIKEAHSVLWCCV